MPAVDQLYSPQNQQLSAGERNLMLQGCNAWLQLSLDTAPHRE